MSEVADSRGRGETTRNHHPPSRGGQSNEGQHAGHAQQPQDFSWQVGQQRQQQMEAYNNFYYPTGPAGPTGPPPAGYSPFSGDIRDSIAAIWSRTSPGSGEGFAAASGGYGQGHGEGQFQFAANLNFAPTSELSMFGAAAANAAAAAAGGDYSYGGQYAAGFGPQYTQWPDNGSGATTTANNSRGGYSYLSSSDLMDVQQGLEGIKVSQQQQQQHKKDNGKGGSKLSWASVASQPAKPQPQPKSAKKPGVLPPPSIIPSKPPVPQQIEKMLQQQPVKQQPPMMMPPPNHHQQIPPQHQQAPPPTMNMPPVAVMNNHHHHQHLQQHPEALQQGLRVAPTMPNHHQQRSNTNGSNMMVSHPILDSLRSINDYNPKSFDMNPKNARYFVIKSFSEDDIHRSIKYEIWCSTDHGNKRLDAAYKAQNGAGPIFLFFSVNGSGHFCGMAEMLSAVDYSSNSSVWVQDKFKGQFKVKWIYVKDVPNLSLRHIRLENNENKPVTNSRDTQEIPGDKGKMVLKIIHGYKHSTSLFDDFVHYEKKQEEEDIKKKQNHSDVFHEEGDRGHDRGGHNSAHHNPHRGRDQRDQRDQRPRGRGGDTRKPPRH